jgi:hypothetical protein
MNPTEIDAPFEDILAECTALLERMDILLGAIEPVTPDEARATLKTPGNGEIVIRELAAHCRETEITRAGCITVDDMTRAWDRAQAIKRVVELADLVHARLAAARFRTESDSWRAALTFYALFRSLSTRDASVKARLETVVTFFRHKARPARRLPVPISRRQPPAVSQ